MGINGIVHLKFSINKAEFFTPATVICIIYRLCSSYSRDTHPFYWFAKAPNILAIKLVQAHLVIYFFSHCLLTSLMESFAKKNFNSYAVKSVSILSLRFLAWCYSKNTLNW